MRKECAKKGMWCYTVLVEVITTMYKYNLLFAALVLLASCASVQSINTPLEDFVYRQDEGWSYVLQSQFSGPGYTAYVLNFTSLNWLEFPKTNKPRWWHFLTVCVPTFVTSNTGFLYVDNGNYASAPPTVLHPLIQSVCLASRSVVSHLAQNPNQPLILDNDNKSRSEDAIIGYTWKKFLENTTDYDWLGQFPETKATVRAFDCISKFMKDSFPPWFPKVKSFVVSGASKRGWASWLAAAVDPRVKAVIPVVMPILDLVKNCENHYKAYGGWSYAYYNYYGEGVMAYMGTPQFDAMAKEIDPINWVDQLLVPKYIVTAVGDQFFIPDSSAFFFHKLLGAKHQRIHPGADHSLLQRWSQFIQEVTTYYNMVINRQSLPDFEWSVIPDIVSNTTAITIVTDKRDCPSSVLLYTADTISTTKRDWRQLLAPNVPQNITWAITPLSPYSDSNVFKTVISAPPAGGWRGAFVELTYDSPFGEQKYTTEFFYAPYTFPFETCAGAEYNNKYKYVLISKGD
ncbi:hypothetical protein DFA_05090 [Cavenderia fasciculata]|uniref:PhoPQ-activated pathogenicity-related protein n=1 Tax=Cavenderia fasciculata TaxID=261658 RepID=F4PNA7_CACFS|nr:uncharacterized protein DFA_05090 [Cavenderia fasciculata]EGG22960.1 hypothetical protein DFA_05090 [Cavenderia fasciculata]|eukprot:XP_004360811.1 hypothetical protein DFA_05090 [Cavenderia fasciculata]